MMKFTPTSLPDVILVEPSKFSDDRGFFMETYQAQQFALAGIDASFVQENHSGSRQGVLRGLHYQVQHPQGKLVRVVSGEVFDIAVDLRRRSQTFGKWVSSTLSAGNGSMLWVPPGFAHGIYVTGPWAEVVYLVTDLYAPQCERTLAWNDPQLAIRWPLIDGQPPLLSAKDAAGKLLAEAEVYE